MYGFHFISLSLRETEVNLAKHQTLKMCNYSSFLSISLEFFSDIIHYNIFVWIKFCRCNLKVGLDMALKIVSLGEEKILNFHFDSTTVLHLPK